MRKKGERWGGLKIKGSNVPGNLHGAPLLHSKQHKRFIGGGERFWWEKVFSSSLKQIVCRDLPDRKKLRVPSFYKDRGRGFKIESASGSTCHTPPCSPTMGLMAWALCPFAYGSAVAGAKRVTSDISLTSCAILPQPPPITVATSTQEPARAAEGARAVSEAMDRIGLLGSRYLSRRPQNKNNL